MLDTNTLVEHSERACKMLKLIGNPNRMRILCALNTDEMAVGDMEETLHIKQPTLSRELGHLRKAGIVSTRRQSRVIFYQLADAKTGRLLGVLCDHFEKEA